jgi:regulator of replication initiation timing
MTQITREMLIDVLDTKLEEKLKPIYDSIGEVKASLKFLSDKYDSVDKRVGELEIKCQTVVQENTFLRAEVLRFSRSLDDVSNEIDNMNQYGRRDCCEISGLPVEHGEDTNKQGRIHGFD